MSTLTGSEILTFALGDTSTPVSPECSTTSSLAKVAWKPLEVTKNGSQGGQQGNARLLGLPPLPKLPLDIPGAETQMVRSEIRTVTYALSIMSEHPNIVNTPTSSDIEPLPNTFYVSPRTMTSPHQFPIGIAIGSSSQALQYQPGETLHTDIIPGKTAPPKFSNTLHTDIIPGKTVPPKLSDTLHTDIIPGKTVPPKLSGTLHTDIIPGKTVPPRLPDADSPAAESFYQDRTSSTPPAPQNKGRVMPTEGTVASTPSAQSTIKVGSALGSPPLPIQVRSPPRNISEEWHPPPQTPTRSLALFARPSAMPQLPANDSPQPGYPHTRFAQSSHSHSDSTSSTAGLVSAPAKTRSFSGNKPSPFKLNPGNQVFPAPPGTSTGLPFREQTSKFSDDGDGNGNNGKGSVKRQWTIHFNIPLILGILFFCGSLSAVLHHIFYSHIHGTAPPHELQQWYTRAGVAISVFTVACWIGCVSICYKQRVWLTLGQKSIKITGIDALWGLTQDPSFFLVGEAWRKSKVAMGLGIIMWILPLSIIFVPGSLTIQPDVHGINQTCLVPTFTPSTDQPLSLPAKDLPLLTTQSVKASLSMAVKRIATVTAFSGNIPDYPLPDGCGGQVNCSYLISFNAPGYKCDVVTPEEAKKDGPWGQFGFEQLFQISNNSTLIYWAKADNRTMVDTSQTTADTYHGFGGFWVAFRSLADGLTTADPSLLNPSKANEVFKEEIFHCVDYIVSYKDVRFVFVDGHMDVQLSDSEDRGIQYVAPVDYTQFSKNNSKDFTDGATLNRAVHEFTLSILEGKMNLLTTQVFSTTQVPGTYLVDEDQNVNAGNYVFPRADLRSKMEELHRNITFSFLSQPRLKGTFYTSSTCETTTSRLIYVYRLPALLATYGAACFLTTIALIVGITSLKSNGFATDFSFSRILCTTRNPVLDEITRGESCLGTASDRVGRQELRFGEILVRGGKKSKEKQSGGVKEEDDLEFGNNKRLCAKEGHAAFGIPSEVMCLRKGRCYE